tara:strand:- start:12 stop:767 length:756 start_codon:yes stop_codon:yes gene_type:complete
MTAYHGGKQRIGKQLAEIIVDTSIEIAEEENFNIIGYCEPFCGMLGVYKHIPELFEEEEYDNLKYLAGDINESVIKMWKAAQKGWNPPITSSKQEYEKFKKSKTSSPKKGFVGHACSFGGIYLSSYQSSRCKYLQSSSQKVKKISKTLYDLKLKSGVYEQFSKLKGFIIYCDPPYKNENNKNNNYYTEDKVLIKFNHDKFWEWCTKLSKHNIVLVSEFSAPKNTKKIKNFKSIIGSKGNYGKQTENLYLVI